MTATLTRSTLLPALGATLGVLLLLAPVTLVAQQTARTRYGDAQAREEAVRHSLDEVTEGAAAPPEVLSEARAVIAAYDAVVRRYPTSGYSDNALLNAAGLADTLHQKFGQARDRETALNLYRRVAAEYPASSLIKQAEASIARLDQTGRSPTAPTIAATPTPSSSVALVPTSPANAATAASAQPAASASTPGSTTTAPAASSNSGRAKLTKIDRAVMANNVRVTLTLDREVAYHEETLEGPARVFFDLRGVDAVPEIQDAVLRYNSDVVRQIRVGRHPQNTIRVVLDLEGTSRHSIYTLYSPFRLVIDCEPGTAVAAASTAKPAPGPLAAPARVTASTPAAPSKTDSAAAQATVAGKSEPLVAPAKAAAKPAETAKATETNTKAAETAKAASKKIDVPPSTVQPRKVVTEQTPMLIVESPLPAGTPIVDTTSAPSAATPANTAPASTAAPAAPVSAKATTPATLAGPPPEAPNANSAGGFSLSRQLGLGVSRIVIDAGHGGHDPGAQSKGLSESELTLDIALRLEQMLKKEPGLEVILTRRTDEYIPLEERTAIANRENADLFLSIHANASRSVMARGVETYFLSFAATADAEAVAARENSANAGEMHKLPDIIKAIALNDKVDESRDLAGMVQEAMVTRLRRSNKDLRNLGVKKAPFVVLIGAGMPSVLAEVSFITNRQEQQLLKTNAYKDRIAEALHAAVMRYRRSLKGTGAIAAQE